MKRINRNQPPTLAERARSLQPRPPASAESIDRFKLSYDNARANLQQRSAHDQEADHAVDKAALVGSSKRMSAASDSDQQRRQSYDSIDSRMEFSAFMAASAELGQVAGPPQARTVAQSPAASLADLIEKHVRRLLISHDGLNRDDGHVMLRLSDASLPGTDLLLSKQRDGWSLHAQTDSQDNIDTIAQFAPQLQERFSELGLGELEIESDVPSALD